MRIIPAHCLYCSPCLCFCINWLIKQSLIPHMSLLLLFTCVCGGVNTLKSSKLNSQHGSVLPPALSTNCTSSSAHIYASYRSYTFFPCTILFVRYKITKLFLYDAKCKLYLHCKCKKRKMLLQVTSFIHFRVQTKILTTIQYVGLSKVILREH